MNLTAAQWNTRYPIGTPVVAYPGIRPEDGADAEQLVTRTRSRAEVLGGHTGVVWVDGHSACINLTHVDPTAPSQSADRVVAYRTYHLDLLLCRKHAEQAKTPLLPVTSEDLPDGGICTWHECGRDVLAGDESTRAVPVPCPPGCVACATDESHDPTPA